MKRLLLASLAFVIIAVGAGALTRWTPGGARGHDLPGVGHSLPMVRPAFAQSATFPGSAAGLAAYVNVGPLDYNTISSGVAAVGKTGGQVKGSDGNGYAWVETQVSGTAGEVSWTTTVDLYVDTNGWVVAFLPRGSNVGVLVEFTGDPPAVSDTNSLQKGLSSIMAPMGKAYSSFSSGIGYYDFSHPAATKLWVMARTTDGVMSFVIPASLKAVDGGIIVVASSRNFNPPAPPSTFSVEPALFTASMVSGRKQTALSLAPQVNYSVSLQGAYGFAFSHPAAAIVIVTQPR